MAFNPKYTITEEILNNLTAIASAHEVIKQSYLAPKWEASLRGQAGLTTAGFLLLMISMTVTGKHIMRL